MTLRILFTALIILFGVISSSALRAQDSLNVTFVSNVAFEEKANEIWGYVDSNGIEYAIIGSVDGVYVFDLQDPFNPQEILFVPGTSSTWRDIKSNKHYVYCIADKGSEGLLVIDLKSPQDSIPWHYTLPLYTPGTNIDTIEQCHNIYIDEENGWCYMSGCNVNNGGIVILDFKVNPKHPIYAGRGDARYSHDNFARNDTVWSADVFAGYFSVIDATDKDNVYTIITQPTTFDFTHNCWLSDDGNYLFTTDEKSKAYVEAYDVSNLMNIRRVDQYRTFKADERRVVPHNVHYFDGYLVTSWYNDGLVILDAHRPENLVRVGGFDTHPQDVSGFNGAWGAYPWLPSGLIIVSDRDKGLFVLQPEYQRAAYLEGRVRNVQTNESITGANIRILEGPKNEVRSDNSGYYGTGIPFSGTVTVIFEHPHYESDTFELEVEQGEIKIQDVDLTPLYQSYVMIGQIVDSKTGEPVAGASVEFKGWVTNYDYITGADGRFGGYFFEGGYNIQCGEWGYKDSVFTIANLQQDENPVFGLDVGYKDRFFVDQGWEIAGDAPRGIWERGIPNQTKLNDTILNPGFDDPADDQSECYVTGNRGNQIGDDDVDVGTTILRSPEINLEGYQFPRLSFSHWHVNVRGDSIPDDTLFVYLVDQSNRKRYLIDQFFDFTQEWEFDGPYSLNHPELDTNLIRIEFEISDSEERPNLVEAGIDNFRITDSVQSTPVNDVSLEMNLRIYPNPASNIIYLESLSELNVRRIELYSLEGILIKSFPKWEEHHLNLEFLESGYYLLSIWTESGQTTNLPLIKLRN